MRSWMATIDGRPIAKKNSRRHVVAGNGRRYVLPSNAYESFKIEALAQLLPQRPPHPFKGDFILYLRLSLKGKMDIDLDNAQASALDLLQDAGIIDDDKHCIEVHASKQRSQPDWRTEIQILDAS